MLIHAAAGGVGLIACQWARYLGATVIGTVGSSDKAELARAHGCHHPILYREEDFVARTREITGGEGVAVVYDSVGRDTFLKSLDCLRPMGMLVLFGQASGAGRPLRSGAARRQGLALSDPALPDGLHRPARGPAGQRQRALRVVESGAVKIEVNQTYPLREVAQAHRDLEARKTTGSTVLLP